MADDLVERLRDPKFAGAYQHLRSFDELDRIHAAAADRIEGQERQIAELRAQLDEARLSAQTIGDELGNVIERLQRLLDEALKALKLAEGRLALLIQQYPDPSETCDHPAATQYVLDQVRAALAATRSGSATTAKGCTG